MSNLRALYIIYKKRRKNRGKINLYYIYITPSGRVTLSLISFNNPNNSNIIICYQSTSGEPWQLEESHSR